MADVLERARHNARTWRAEAERLRDALTEIHAIADTVSRDADMDEALNEIVLLAHRALDLDH